ncbi:MAG: hypothetical protein A3G23_02800 [Bacteroidetes bacterium RIFCSPLOWO2_12_FULL_37_12]|nr:MAG: hypothetical protein A3G23_02800 [Bacteroidetes bacterium RIFCSPLOWO2_12_FULL_37_12]
MKSRLFILFLLFPALLCWQSVSLFSQEKTKGKFGFFNGSKEKGEFPLEENTLFVEGMREYMLGNFNSAINYFEKVIQQNSKNDAAYYQIGLILFSQGFYNNALPYAQNAISLDNRNEYYYQLLSNVYEALLQFPDAIKIIKKLIEEVSASEEYLFELAGLYLYNSQPEEALKTYNQIEKKIGLTPEVSLQKQKIFLQLNRLDDAIITGEKLIEKFPAETDLLVKHAFLLFTNSRHEQAKVVYQKILEIEPSNHLAHLGLSEIYRGKGEFYNACKELEKVIINQQVDFETKERILYNNLSFITVDDSLRDLILSMGETFVNQYLDNPRSHTLYGDLLYRAKRNDDALKSYLTASQFKNPPFQLWQQILLIESELNRIDDLLNHSEQAIELYPNHPIILLFNGNANLQKKNYKKAIKSLERGAKLSSGDIQLFIQFYSLLGDAYNGTKMHEESDSAYETVLRFERDNAHALNNYSYFLSLRGKNLEKAEEMGRRLVEYYPDNSTYLDTYGWILYKMQNYEKAKQFLEKAVSHSPNSVIVEHLGDILFRLNDKEGAFEYWLKAKQLGNGSEFLDKKISTRLLYE